MGAFTLKQFLDVNSCQHHIYLGGSLSYSDPALDRTYELIPEGMVSRFSPLLQSSSAVAGSRRRLVHSLASPVLDYDNIDTSMYVRIAQHSWTAVANTLSVRNLPDPVQYPQETWEWTIGRDYKNRIVGKCILLYCALFLSFHFIIFLLESESLYTVFVR